MVSIVQSVCTLALIFSLLEGGHFNSTDAQPIFKDPDLGVESTLKDRDVIRLNMSRIMEKYFK